MAQKTTVAVIDDLDGSEGAKPVRFAIENGQYEIDLTDENVAKLYEALDPFLSHARKVGSRPAGSSSTNQKRDLGAIREWAQANGHQVAARGRVPQAVIDAYNSR